MNNTLSGTGVALVTPFDQNAQVDFQALTALVEYLIVNGVDYLVVLGTTAETATLNSEEKKKVLNHVLSVNKQRVPVVLGHGGNHTQELINQFDEIDFSQISAILSVSPYYNKPTQEGIYQHYKAICSNSPVPVILYNVPGRTASNLTADTTLRLAKDFNNIIGIKEASGNMEQIMKILNHKPDNFMVISGDDALTLPMMSCGAVGVISVVANAYPYEFSKMVKLALEGDFASARKYHFDLLEIIDNLFVEGNPAGIKAALKIKNLMGDYLRLPLVNVSEKTFEKLKTLNDSLLVK